MRPDVQHAADTARAVHLAVENWASQYRIGPALEVKFAGASAAGRSGDREQGVSLVDPRVRTDGAIPTLWQDFARDFNTLLEVVGLRSEPKPDRKPARPTLADLPTPTADWFRARTEGGWLGESGPNVPALTWRTGLPMRLAYDISVATEDDASEVETAAAVSALLAARHFDGGIDVSLPVLQPDPEILSFLQAVPKPDAAMLIAQHQVLGAPRLERLGILMGGGDGRQIGVAVNVLIGGIAVFRPSGRPSLQSRPSERE
jgi:hypothetical protein